MKALASEEIYQNCCPVVVGDASILEHARDIVGIDLKVHKIRQLSEARYECGTIDVLDRGGLNPGEFPIGEISKQAGQAAFEYVEKVITLAMNREIDATVTNPINKAAINLAGHPYSGHTEIYADYTGTKKYTMLLAHENLRVRPCDDTCGIKAGMRDGKKGKSCRSHQDCLERLQNNGNRKSESSGCRLKSPCRGRRTVRQRGNRGNHPGG